jgi:hypothetical protein
VPQVVAVHPDAAAVNPADIRVEVVRPAAHQAGPSRSLLLGESGARAPLLSSPLMIWMIVTASSLIRSIARAFVCTGQRGEEDCYGARACTTACRRPGRVLAAPAARALIRK